MKRIISFSTLLSVIVITILAAMTITTVTAADGDTIYLIPPTSSAEYCNTVDVEIWVDATDFQSGQIELLYDSGCCEVTNFVRNTGDFAMGGWDSTIDGREWITFMNVVGPITGNYLIGTLTIHCLNEGECTTILDVDNDASKLFDKMGAEITATWINGEFNCESGGVPPDNEVYLDPSTSSAEYCNTVDVEIWVDATDFQSGQIELLYDSGCCEVTNFVRNTGDFAMGGWDSTIDGREWITFMNVVGPITGNYLIGTLTIHCLNEGECTTILDVDNDASKLFDKMGAEITSIWINGEFSCEGGVVPPDNEVYLDPSTSGAEYCNTVDVEIWVDAADFQSGQIELLYDSGCCEVTNFVRNTGDFAMGGWDSTIDGREWITFMNVVGPITGNYLIGTLTIHCLNEGECTTILDVDNDASKLFDKMGAEITSTWINGEFSCEQGQNDPPIVTVIYPNGGETLSGMVTLNATATDTDGTITSVVFSYSADGGTNWNGLGDGNHVGNDIYEYSWDTTSVADGSNYKIEAVATDNDGAIDEDTSDSVFEIDNSGCSCDYCLQLEAGLSLVSIPRTIDGSNNATTVFNIDSFSGERCLYYNASTGKYDEVPFDNVEVKPCRGYWVEKKEPYTVCVNFSETGLPSQQLLEGWNMIGNPSLYEIVIFEEGNSADFGSITKLEYPLDNPLYSQINRYNQDTGMENYPLNPNFKHMTPGLGYLILMNEDVMMYGIP